MDYLSESKFINCLQEYIRRWAGKHPMPYDFFNTFNEISGENLDWFWKSWYFDAGYPDLGISMPDSKTIAVENIGKLPISFKIKIENKDGSFDEIKYNLKIWKNFRTKLVIPVAKDKQVSKVSIHYDRDIDIEPQNNVFTLK
jgi:aminopeptidase N